MPEGSFLHRIVGADGITQVTALADQPTDATPGLVIKSSDLRDIKELLALILLELRDRK